MPEERNIGVSSRAQRAAAREIPLLAAREVTVGVEDYLDADRRIERVLELIDKSEFTFGQPPDLPPPHMLEAFEKAWDTLLLKVEKMDDAGWNRKGRFMMNGQVRMEQPIGGFLWLFFFDAIHHRGQLSTYIRPMGGKVPSIYGPSGDDPMMLSVSHRKME